MRIFNGYKIGAKAHLVGANLYGADLGGANLYGADLYEANLRGANLNRADLVGANLYGADLSGANLYGADLYEANLRGANLNKANLNEASLDEAKGYRALPVADPRGYHHHAIWRAGEWRVQAGCRDFSIAEARKHWGNPKYLGPQQVAMFYPAALDWLEGESDDA